MKKRLLSVAIVTALATTNMAFAGPDTKGDSLIQSPEQDSTVDTDSPEIWFALINGAIGYTFDMVGVAPEDDPCANDATYIYEKTKFIPAAGLDCGEETQATKAGDGDVAAVHLCSVKSEILANGEYAVAINPVTIGTDKVSLTEKRGTCGNDAVGYSNNNPVNMTTAGGNNKNYQKFTVDVPSTGGGPTQEPNIPEPFLPALGTSVDDAEDKLTFTDSSPEEGKATWYELWVYDKDNVRVTDFDDNPGHPGWYKLTVDSELSCMENANAAGDRVCTIDVSSSSILDDAADDDEFTWWVRGWNEIGMSAWSTAPSKFTK